eukprot:Protomagalhaensia_wolfi_Nauph_80__5132@NODE_548_length_2327_cov_58_473776_g408_i0_p2_GENE_NODE_548_length_2327_cov_58_473776_g408_i0NODE_548_length_2327_cov_58_473776_g408_i0_p2_ORF_typecomplete_len148_score24_51Histone/PF00125_24/5_7e21TFIID_20kDa/PF03847_13/0_15_NODE_548_length_2327_cov_58_473776_g408_i0121564
MQATGRGKSLSADMMRSGGRSGKTLSSNASNASTSASASPNKKKKKTSSGSKTEMYHTYINKLLRQIRPEIRITARAMSIMNSFVLDAFERIAGEAGKLCTITKKETMTSREIQTAVQLVLSGELAKHAVQEGRTAVQASSPSLKRV